LKARKIYLLALIAILMVSVIASGCSSQSTATEKPSTSNIKPNVKTSFNSTVDSPEISAKAFIDPQGAVIGNVHVGDNVYVAPFASLRGDEGQSIWIGNNTNVQDGVIVHALETEENGEAVEKNLMDYNGKKYAVYVGNNVSLAHQSQVHGPATVDDNTFIGMQAFVFKAKVGKGCVLEPTAKVIGVSIPDGRYVPAGTVVTTQDQANKLPEITDTYVFKDLNKGVLHVNEQLAEGYLGEHK